MRQIWIITKRELNVFFDSLIAYILLVLFIGFTGFFTWIYGNDVFMLNQATLAQFFQIAFWTVFIFIPAITMRMFSEEYKTGTIELLLTKPLYIRQVIAGKFLSSLLLITIALLLSLPYYITVSSLGNIDHGSVILGYLGLLLMSASYISIGLFASSLMSNQIVSFLGTFAITIFFHLLFGTLSNVMPGFMGDVMLYLDLTSHFDSISRGILDSKDVIYFVSVIFLGLYGTEMVMAQKTS